jgi:hypothetical protein
VIRHDTEATATAPTVSSLDLQAGVSLRPDNLVAFALRVLIGPQRGKAARSPNIARSEHMQAYSKSSTEWLSWRRRFLGLFLS